MPPRLGHRADIDGLRAVAVLPVLLFHGGFPGFSGGFVGVDVFFVISGYLISTIILEDLYAGRFSLLTFYERRIRRIFPALFTMLLLALVLGTLLLLPRHPPQSRPERHGGRAIRIEYPVLARDRLLRLGR